MGNLPSRAPLWQPANLRSNSSVHILLRDPDGAPAPGRRPAPNPPARLVVRSLASPTEPLRQPLRTGGTLRCLDLVGGGSWLVFDPTAGPCHDRTPAPGWRPPSNHWIVGPPGQTWNPASVLAAVPQLIVHHQLFFQGLKSRSAMTEGYDVGIVASGSGSGDILRLTKVLENGFDIQKSQAQVRIWLDGDKQSELVVTRQGTLAVHFRGTQDPAPDGASILDALAALCPEQQRAASSAPPSPVVQLQSSTADAHPLSDPRKAASTTLRIHLEHLPQQLDRRYRDVLLELTASLKKGDDVRIRTLGGPLTGTLFLSGLYAPANALPPKKRHSLPGSASVPRDPLVRTPAPDLPSNLGQRVVFHGLELNLLHFDQPIGRLALLDCKLGYHDPNPDSAAPTELDVALRTVGLGREWVIKRNSPYPVVRPDDHDPLGEWAEALVRRFPAGGSSRAPDRVYWDLDVRSGQPCPDFPAVVGNLMQLLMNQPESSPRGRGPPPGCLRCTSPCTSHRVRISLTPV